MFNSIRIRLTLWYLGVLALIIISFAFGTYLLIDRNANQRTNENLAEIARSIKADLRREEADIAAKKLNPDKETEPDEDEKGRIEPVITIETAIIEELADLRLNEYGFIILTQNGQLVATTITDEEKINTLINLPAEFTFADFPGKGETFRVHRHSLELEGKQFSLLVSRSIGEQTGFLSNLKKIFLLAVPFALVLAGFSGYFLARRSLAPVASMSRQAEKISSSNLDERLPIKNEDDEIGGLAKVFNALLTRLENSFGQQRRFMADASHELRTPLAIVRTEAEVALSKDTRTNEEYQTSLTVIHEESKHLTKIVEDLFLLARADSRQLLPHLTNVNLEEILADSVRAISVLAEKRKVKINFPEFGKMPLQADESLLHRLFLNLLDNAVKYNRENGTVFIVAETFEKYYRVTISDTGPGIEKEEQGKIFERFYRIDKARNSNIDESNSGAGLGLSIAAWIAQVHRGSLRLEKSDAKGSVFIIELPRFTK